MIYIDGVAVGREDMSTNNRSTMDYQSENTIKKEQKKKENLCLQFIHLLLCFLLKVIDIEKLGEPMDQ